MSEVSSNIIWVGTSCEGLSPGRSPLSEHHRPGSHQKTDRTEWSKEMNVDVMKCYF